MKLSSYIKREFDAGKHPVIDIRHIAGEFRLYDKNDKLLDTNPFKTRGDAEHARSKALDRGRRHIRFI